MLTRRRLLPRIWPLICRRGDGDLIDGLKVIAAATMAEMNQYIEPREVFITTITLHAQVGTWVV